MLDLRTLSTITDFFVICTAGSSRQVAALKDHIEATLLRQGSAVGHTEGTSAPSRGGPNAEPLWMLMDCGDLVVHLLDQSARSFYRLEHLWADAPRVPVPAPAAQATGDQASAARNR